MVSLPYLRRLPILALFVLCLGMGLQVRGAWQDSLTSDEITHISAGVSYWKTNDYRLNSPHPSLFKLWATLPLLAFPHLNLDTSSQAWQAADQWAIGEQFVYHSDAAIGYSRWIVFAARLPMILITAAIGWMLYRWSKERWGEWAGIISLSAFTFDPNILGHGHLVNNDVALAGAFFATVWAAEKMFAAPSWKRVWITSLLMAITIQMKFSGIFIYPVIGLLALIAIRRYATWNWSWIRRLFVAGVVAFVVTILLSYGGTIGRPFRASGLGQVTTNQLLPRIETVLRNIPLPAPSFFNGLRSVIVHNESGHPAYLLGDSNTTGWWYYFPVAVATKTPLLFLLGALLVMGMWWSRRRFLTSSERTTLLLYALPPILFFGWALTSHINIGLRHVFIIYPFLYAMVGALVLIRRPTWFTAQRLALGWSGACLVIALFAGSHTIAYFNGAAGGTSAGWKILRDSNLDWQQDVWRLQTYLQSRQLANVKMSINAMTDIHAYFPDAQPVETDDQLAAGDVPSGVYAVSVRWLYDATSGLRWLREQEPLTSIGSTIRIYEF